MKFWKNTATLDALVPALKETVPAEEAELAVIGSKPIDVTTMPALRGLFKCGVGRDNVPFADCEQRGIKICFPSPETSRYIFEETANFAVYLIYRMLYADAGDLATWKKHQRTFLGKKKVLLLGQGNIGQHVRRKLEPSVEVMTFDILHNEIEELPGMLAQADVVSIHIPLLDTTREFVDAGSLAHMKDGAALVNTARGPIVDEDALYTELKSGRLRAAFDVFWKEPYEGKLRDLHPDPFLMSPHVASTCLDFLSGLALDFNQFAQELA